MADKLLEESEFKYDIDVEYKQPLTLSLTGGQLSSTSLDWTVNVADKTFWAVYMSRFHFKVAVQDSNGAQMTSAAGVTFSMNAPAAAIKSSWCMAKGKYLENYTNYQPQIDTICKRTRKSKEELDVKEQDRCFMHADFFKRQAALASDGQQMSRECGIQTTTRLQLGYDATSTTVNNTIAVAPASNGIGGVITFGWGSGAADSLPNSFLIWQPGDICQLSNGTNLHITKVLTTTFSSTNITTSTLACAESITFATAGDAFVRIRSTNYSPIQEDQSNAQELVYVPAWGLFDEDAGVKLPPCREGYQVHLEFDPNYATKMIESLGFNAVQNTNYKLVFTDIRLAIYRFKAAVPLASISHPLTLGEIGCNTYPYTAGSSTINAQLTINQGSTYMLAFALQDGNTNTDTRFPPTLMIGGSSAGFLAGTASRPNDMQNLTGIVVQFGSENKPNSTLTFKYGSGTDNFKGLYEDTFSAVKPSSDLQKFVSEDFKTWLFQRGPFIAIRFNRSALAGPGPVSIQLTFSSPTTSLGNLLLFNWYQQQLVLSTDQFGQLSDIQRLDAIGKVIGS